eukprot:5608032-Prymnesium_polylepis.1
MCAQFHATFFVVSSSTAQDTAARQMRVWRLSAPPHRLEGKVQREECHADEDGRKDACLLKVLGDQQNPADWQHGIPNTGQSAAHAKDSGSSSCERT